MNLAYEQADNASVGFFSNLLTRGLDILPQVINPKSATQTTAEPTPGGTGVAVARQPNFFEQNKTLILIGAGVAVVGIGALIYFKS